MTNLKLYSALLSKGIADANSTDQGELYINEFMEMSVPEVCNMLYAVAEQMLDLKGDEEYNDEIMADVTLKQLMEYVYQST